MKLFEVLALGYYCGELSLFLNEFHQKTQFVHCSISYDYSYDTGCIHNFLGDVVSVTPL